MITYMLQIKGLSWKGLSDLFNIIYTVRSKAGLQSNFQIIVLSATTVVTQVSPNMKQNEKNKMKLNDVGDCLQTFLWQIKLDLFRLLSVLFLEGNQISHFKLSDFNICFSFNSMQHSLLRLLYVSDTAQEA